jgi:hypothetical protein
MGNMMLKFHNNSRNFAQVRLEHPQRLQADYRLVFRKRHLISIVKCNI